MTSRASQSPADQPYNIVLAGRYGVGKSSLFRKLSGEVHADYQYRAVPTARNSSRTTGQQFGQWTHTALVDGDTVKVMNKIDMACNCHFLRVSPTCL